jgi:phosphoribosylamine--glycine ligase
VERVSCAPGNGGTQRLGQNHPVSATDAEGIVALAVSQHIDLVVLGPDAAVAAGVGDALSRANVLCFGPSRQAGRLESSKSFAKELMQRSGVATPAFAVFDDHREATQYLRRRGAPVVVKADGPALGKGAFVSPTVEDATAALDRLMLRRELGASGERVVIEEWLEGEEESFFAICDGESAVMLPPARDYKRALDGDLGGMTGGMGGFAPASPDRWRELNRRVLEEIVEPTLTELRRLGTPYRGCLYVGAMLVGDTIQVLEFNARFGDPETEVQLPLLPDLVPVLWQSARGELEAPDPAPNPGACVGVVAVREPYPEAIEAGGEVHGLEAAEELGCLVFQMGTRAASSEAVEVAGGRVLICAAVAEDRQSARKRAYLGLEAISFAGMRYRLDIGA